MKPLEFLPWPSLYQPLVTFDLLGLISVSQARTHGLDATAYRHN